MGETCTAAFLRPSEFGPISRISPIAGDLCPHCACPCWLFFRLFGTLHPSRILTVEWFAFVSMYHSIRPVLPDPAFQCRIAATVPMSSVTGPPHWGTGPAPPRSAGSSHSRRGAPRRDKGTSRRPADPRPRRRSHRGRPGRGQRTGPGRRRGTATPGDTPPPDSPDPPGSPHRPRMYTAVKRS